VKVFDKVFVKFTTAGCLRQNEPLIVHGRLLKLIPVEDSETLGYRAVIAPSGIADFLRRLRRGKDSKYTITLPTNEDAVFYPSLFNPHPDLAEYITKYKQKMTVCYLGSMTTGEPVIDDLKVMEMVDRLVYEKGAYKYVALKAFNLLGKLSKAQHQVDSEFIGKYIEVLDKLKRIESRGPGRPPKTELEQAVEGSTGDEISVEDVEKGHGLLSRIMRE